MKLFVYAFHDNVADRNITYTMEYSDGAAVRDFIRSYLQLFAPRDCTIYRIADVIQDNGADYKVIPLRHPIAIDWKSYRSPESIAEALAPLGASPDEINQAFKEANEKLGVPNLNVNNQ